MKKILVVPFIIWNLHAQNFDAFMQNALQNSPYLKANALNAEQVNEESKIIQRYKNPTLSLEASRFNPDVGNSASGYRGAFSQPILLWGVGDAKEKLGMAMQEEANSLTKLKRAEFVRDLSLLYINYTQQSKFVALAKEELKIAQKISHISKERYKAGTIAKSRYLLSKVDSLSAKNRVNTKEAEKFSSYWKLLAFAGIADKIELDYHHDFILSHEVNLQNSARLQYLNNSQKKAEKQAKLNSNKIEWIDIYAEYEKEPNQNIARVGVDIPLAIFNKKTEEKRIASLKAKQNEYLIKNQQIRVSHKLMRINSELKILQKVLTSTKKLYASQKELLGMYEDGYKIANINLIELQNIKNKMIKTRETEISLQTKIDTNIVIYNYETGEYNE